MNLPLMFPTWTAFYNKIKNDTRWRYQFTMTWEWYDADGKHSEKFNVEDLLVKVIEEQQQLHFSLEQLYRIDNTVKTVYYGMNDIIEQTKKQIDFHHKNNQLV